MKALWICRCSGAKGMWHNLDERRSLQPPAMQVFRSTSMPLRAFSAPGIGWPWSRSSTISFQTPSNMALTDRSRSLSRIAGITSAYRFETMALASPRMSGPASLDASSARWGRRNDAAASPALRRAPKPGTAPGPRSLIVLSGARARISRSPIRPLVPRATPSANGCDPGTIGVTPGSQHQANFSKVRQWSATMSADYCSCFGPPPFQAIRRRLPGPAGHARSREPSEFDLIATRQPV